MEGGPVCRELVGICRPCFFFLSFFFLFRTTDVAEMFGVEVTKVTAKGV